MTQVEDAPKKVQNYIIGEQLGKGTYAKVYLVTDENTGLKYAMKVIKRQSLSETALQRLQREIAIMQALKHPNTVHLYNILQNSSRFMLVMDFIPRGELLQSIRAPLPEALAALYFTQIAATVRYFHQLGIQHRDLKFENVLLADDSKVYVADFGLGAVSNSPDKTFFTCKTTCGSPHYIAPEVADAEKYDGRRADIWSLGILLFTMLAFKFPFNGTDVREIFENARTCNYQYPEFFTQEARNLISSILVKDPEKRATIEEIFDSTFFQKYAQVDSEKGEITTGTLVVPFRPDQNKQKELETLHKILKIDSQPVQQSPDSCPFCDFALKVPPKNDVIGFDVKKAFAMPNVKSPKGALAAVCAALRGVSDTQISVVMHKFLVRIEGVEIRLFSPSQGKYYGSIGCKDIDIQKKFNAGLLKAISAGVGFTEVENVKVMCE
ncbi:Kinase, CAMK CAMKL [Spironucleus salmonicida]|uniref:non-specific serine/threonine protein kinase n=1 Tax=Spironucleus salmonicida TaxID=348837 RepID=V6LLU4_9EUKA|nr:Kinase, CAMK CAMKL [Spironucleus salmonicida]KAH0572701.1 Kinase, CAMK CAMKL [Spironucleus salmonicida]|eukprot:EST44671.1 Kinase, CAMK CAMKL [Spironucleus salmonicida]